MELSIFDQSNSSLYFTSCINVVQILLYIFLLINCTSTSVVQYSRDAIRNVYEKKIQIVIVYNSTIYNKANTHLSFQTIEHTKNTTIYGVGNSDTGLR